MNGDCLDVNGDGECDYGLQLVWELVEDDIGLSGVDAEGGTYDLTGFSTYQLFVESTGQLLVDVYGL